MPRRANISPTRRTRVRSWTFVTLLATGIASSPQTAHGDFRIGVRGGAFLPTSDLSLPEQDVGVACGSTYAVEAGWTPSSSFALEARWQQVFGGLSLGDARSMGGDLDVDALTAGLRYWLGDPHATLRPYVSGQVGWYHATGRTTQQVPSVRRGGAPVGGTITRGGDTIGLNAAVGISLRLTRSISLEAEARYHYTSELDFVTPLAGFTVSFAP